MQTGHAVGEHEGADPGAATDGPPNLRDLAQTDTDGTDSVAASIDWTTLFD